MDYNLPPSYVPYLKLINGLDIVLAHLFSKHCDSFIKVDLEVDLYIKVKEFLHIKNNVSRFWIGGFPCPKRNNKSTEYDRNTTQVYVPKTFHATGFHVVYCSFELITLSIYARMIWLLPTLPLPSFVSNLSIFLRVSHQWCDLFHRLLHSYTRHIERVEKGERDIVQRTQN